MPTTEEYLATIKERKASGSEISVDFASLPEEVDGAAVAKELGDGLSPEYGQAIQDRLSGKSKLKLNYGEAMKPETPSLPGPGEMIQGAVDSVKAVNAGVVDAAKAVAKPLADPIDSAIKAADDKFAAKLPPIAQTLVAAGVSAAMGKTMDETLDKAMPELPGFAKRGLKDYAAGVVGLGGGAGGMLRAAGFENLGSLIAKSSKETAAKLMPPDPKMVDEVASGLGAITAFAIPGFGVEAGASRIALFAPRLATFLGVGTPTVLQAGVAGGEVYNRVMEKTGDKNEASLASSRAFWANIPTIYFTNKMGIYGEQASRFQRAFDSMLMGATQGPSQQLIANFAAHDPIMAGVLESMPAAALAGGIAGLASPGMHPQAKEGVQEAAGAPKDQNGPGAVPAENVAPAQASEAAGAPAQPVATGEAPKTTEMKTAAELEGGGGPSDSAPPAPAPAASPYGVVEAKGQYADNPKAFYDTLNEAETQLRQMRKEADAAKAAGNEPQAQEMAKQYEDGLASVKEHAGASAEAIMRSRIEGSPYTGIEVQKGSPYEGADGDFSAALDQTEKEVKGRLDAMKAIDDQLASDKKLSKKKRAALEDERSGLRRQIDDIYSEVEGAAPDAVLVMRDRLGDEPSEASAGSVGEGPTESGLPSPSAAQESASPSPRPSGKEGASSEGQRETQASPYAGRIAEEAAKNKWGYGSPEKVVQAVSEGGKIHPEILQEMERALNNEANSAGQEGLAELTKNIPSTDKGLLHYTMEWMVKHSRGQFETLHLKAPEKLSPGQAKNFLLSAERAIERFHLGTEEALPAGMLDAVERFRKIAYPEEAKAAVPGRPVIGGFDKAMLERFAAEPLVSGQANVGTGSNDIKPGNMVRYKKAGLIDAEGKITAEGAKAVVELGRINALMEKGFIDQPALASTARMSVKKMLEDVVTYNQKTLLSTLKDGWLTDGKVAMRILDKDRPLTDEYAKLPRPGDLAVAIDRIMPTEKDATDKIIGVVGARDERNSATYLLETEGGRLIQVNGGYYNLVKERYPNSTWKASPKPNQPIRIEQAGEPVAVLMPMKYEERPVFSTETGESVVNKRWEARKDIDGKSSQADQQRDLANNAEASIKSNEQLIDQIESIPGKKTEVALRKLLDYQQSNEKLKEDALRARTEAANIEEQIARVREESGLTDKPVAGLLRKRKTSGGGGRGSAASKDGFAYDLPVELGGMEDIRPFRMPELVRLASDLLGKVPEVGGVRGNTRGLFKGRPGSPEILLNPEIFKSPEQAAKTLAHEVGHLIDYLPDETLKRGNLLGRLMTLRNFLKDSFGTWGDMEGLNTEHTTSKQLREELWAVSKYWKPIDESAVSASHLAYRKSSVELYADAISVLFNSPGTLERMAPNFYKSFFENLDQKPAAKMAFFQMQDFLHQPEMSIQESRSLDRRAMYMTAEELWKKKRSEQAAAELDYGQAIKQMIVDKHQKIIGMIDAEASKGNLLPASKDPRYLLEEMSLADNANHALLYRIQEDVIKGLQEHDLHHLELGDYLYLTRVAEGDRQAFANPKGYTPEEARKALDFKKEQLGDIKFQQLEQAAAKFRDIAFKMAEEATEVGAYSKQVFNEKILPNKGSYAAFAVQEHLENYMTAGIKEQIGTLKDIANPFTATVMKLVALNRLIMKQKTGNAVRDFLMSRVGEISPAEVINRGDNISQYRAEKGKGLLEMLEDGKRVAYNVDPYIAEAFTKKPAGTFMVAVKALDSVFNGVFRPLYITFNMGFQFWSNPLRDFQRTRRNYYALSENESYFSSLKSILLNYAESLPAAARRSAGIDDKIINEMIANKSLDITFTDYSFDPEKDQFQSQMAKMGLLKPKDGEGFIDRAAKVKMLVPVVSAMEAVRFVGNTWETVSKVAGYKALKSDMLRSLDRAIREADPADRAYLKEQRELLAKGEGEYAHLLAYNTRNFVGTPNWKRTGTVTKITNTVFPFSNIMLQGIRSDLDIATRPTTRTGFMLDMMVTQVMPKMLTALAAAGVAGDELKEFFGKISEYDKTNYITIPLGWMDGKDGGRKAVYVRIPHDESGRLIAAVTWKLMNALKGDPQAWAQVMDLGMGQLPKISPPLTIASNWSTFLSGQNPYDSFRGRPIISDTAFKAGGTYALSKMVLWTMNAMGLSSFATHDDKSQTTTEKAIQLAPLINRMIRITDYGEQEAAKKKIAEKQAEDARRSLDRGQGAKDFTQERYTLLEKKHAGILSSTERIRLAKLNRVNGIYEVYSKSIKRALDKGKMDEVEDKRNRLDEILSKIDEE